MTTTSVLPLGSVAQREASSINSEASIRDAAQQFEAILLKQMFRELRSSSLAESVSASSGAYREMADEQMANHLAKSGAFGFGKAMADQMLAQIRGASLIVPR